MTASPKKGAFFWLVLQCLVAVVIPGTLTPGFHSKHTAFFASPTGPAGCHSPWVILSSRTTFQCQRVSGLERADRLDVQRTGCPSTSSPVANAILPDRESFWLSV